MAITTDIIAGFPGETDAEFAESLEFVQPDGFCRRARFYLFGPPRHGSGPHGGPGARSRCANGVTRRCAAVLAEASLRYRRRFVGAELEVLWEATDAFGPDGWHLHGLTDNYLRVTALSPERLWNQLSQVRLVELDGEGLAGVIV